jgi:hypothetical protein
MQQCTEVKQCEIVRVTVSHRTCTLTDKTMYAKFEFDVCYITYHFMCKSTNAFTCTLQYIARALHTPVNKPVVLLAHQCVQSKQCSRASMKASMSSSNNKAAAVGSRHCYKLCTLCVQCKLAVVYLLRSAMKSAACAYSHMYSVTRQVITTTNIVQCALQCLHACIAVFACITYLSYVFSHGLIIAVVMYCCICLPR